MIGVLWFHFYRSPAVKFRLLIAAAVVLLSGCSTMQERNEPHADKVAALASSAVVNDRGLIQKLLINSYIECDEYNGTCTAYSKHRVFINKAPAFFVRWDIANPDISAATFGTRLQWFSDTWLFIESAGIAAGGQRIETPVSCGREITNKGNVRETCVGILNNASIAGILPSIVQDGSPVVRVNGARKYYDLEPDELDEFKQHAQWLAVVMNTAGNAILAKRG